MPPGTLNNALKQVWTEKIGETMHHVVILEDGLESRGA